MKKRGEITVFLSLSLLCVFALLCVMVESARMAGSRYYFQTAVNGALDNLFSQYHRELWKKYRILGLPYESQEEIGSRLESYVQKYLEVENWYPIELEKLEISRCDTLVSRGGDLLAQEIVDYMKYGVWSELELSPEAGLSFVRDMEEAMESGKLAEDYTERAKEVQKLEKCVEKIAACMENQEDRAERIARELASDDAGGFRSAAKAFRREAGRLDGLIEDYDEQAEKIRKKQGVSGKTTEADGPYAAYIDEDGARRLEILEQAEITVRNLELLSRTESLADELEEAWEAEKEEAKKRAAEENGTSLKDRLGLSWREEVGDLSLGEAEALWSDFTHTTMVVQKSKGDEEKRKLLDRIKDMAQGGLLKLVLPEGAKVSGESLPRSGLPSQTAAGKSTDTPNPLERALIHEYCGTFFTNAMSEESHPVQYELEYLLQGKNTDRKNLEGVASELLLVRQGLNLAQILADPMKREEAHNLALLIVGITGIAPLIEITAFFIMGIWAVGEAIVDLRELFRGGCVPVWKSAEQWQLSLDGLLDMGEKKSCPEKEMQQSGLNYEGYLKLLLFLTDHQILQMRILDVIQMNLQREDSRFSISNCAYQVDILGQACGKHVFFELPIVDNFVEKVDKYDLAAKAARAY